MNTAANQTAPLLPGRLLLALVGCLVFLGCKTDNYGQTEPTRLSGKVTYNGNPVTGGVIKFFLPSVGKTRVAATARIKPDGTYQAAGLPVGKFQVAIDTEAVKKVDEMREKTTVTAPPKIAKDAAPPPSGGMKPPSLGVYVEIPGRYANPRTSKLTVEIQAGEQTKDFILKD
jgi:hypothetical protein